MKSIIELGQDLGEGRTTSRALVEECLERIEDPAGEGTRAFLSVDAEGARAAADYQDALRAAGVAVSPLAGIPVSIKDLFDISGQVTRAGSKALDGPPASADAPAVARLRAAGMVIVGRTNMTEFAFSGLGLNPHYDTPSSPWDRASRRLPGGSSAGAAVSVADGMAVAAVGTDTGGSCRIPAQFCGVVGFKPSSWRVPLEGAYPLSSSLDSIGPFGRTVSCCALMDAALAGDPMTAPDPVGPKGLRLAVPQTLVLDALDDAVASTFRHALDRLSAAGAVIEDVVCGEWGELPEINAKGGIAAAEAYALHSALIEEKGDLYDQRVRRRILGGAKQSAADYIETLKARERLIEAFETRAAAYDAFVMPTVAMVAPPIAPLLDDDALYDTTNRLALRNTSVGNFLDTCAISVPCEAPGEAPVGLMLMAPNGHDDHVFRVARGAEAILSAERN
jgi:aspartyl-tRNA(Asn)/glutamyl-tRNA(Gln) amidotransferase subunit A